MKLRDNSVNPKPNQWKRGESLLKFCGDCTLCNRERLEILKQARSDPTKLINSCNEICGACRHKPRFHRYPNTDPKSTDEAPKRDKKVKSKARKVNTEV